MALWDMWLNGQAFRDPDAKWAIDGFEGAHAIPQRKDVVVSPPGSSGGASVFGPYEITPFVLTGWASADTEDEAERAVSDVLGRFGHGWTGDEDIRLTWKGVDGHSRNGSIRVMSGAATREYAGLYRITLACENLWGAWYGDWRTISGTLNSTPVKLDLPNQFPSFRADVTVSGAVTNPVISIGTDKIGYMGTISAGSSMSFVSSPASVTNGTNDYLHRCTYAPYRGALYAARGSIAVSGSAVGTGAKWSLGWAPVLV